MHFFKRSKRSQQATKDDIGRRKAIQQRIRKMEEAISKAKEYLETGKNARWPGFRPLFVTKSAGGESRPPHRDWVRNVFIPRCERTLRRAERILQHMGA